MAKAAPRRGLRHRIAIASEMFGTRSNNSVISPEGCAGILSGKPLPTRLTQGRPILLKLPSGAICFDCDDRLHYSRPLAVLTATIVEMATP